MWTLQQDVGRLFVQSQLTDLDRITHRSTGHKTWNSWASNAPQIEARTSDKFNRLNSRRDYML
jgi:hypothetical protein